MVKKFIILIIMCFSPNFVFSYDFTNIDDIKRCQSDPNCYLCSNNNIISQCEQKNPYNPDKGIIDTSVFHWVCNDKDVKVACDIEMNKKISEKSEDQPKMTITCPLDTNKPCYKEGDGYYCSFIECTAGSDLVLKSDEGISDDNLIDISSKKEESQICSVDAIRIADGNFMSCRVPAKHGIQKNCCETSMNNKKAQEQLISGAVDALSIISVFTPVMWATVLSDLFQAIPGLADFDYVGEVLGDILTWLAGGACSENEIMAATLSSSTSNITYNSNNTKIGDSGNCVYFGKYCASYSGSCLNLFGKKYPIVSWCERSARAYCCYSNIFDKALAKAARDQMPYKYNWGTIKGTYVYPVEPKSFSEDESLGYNPGENVCYPDYKEINLNCNGVSISDLVNLNLDTPEFNADIEAYVDVLTEDMTKPGGAIDQAKEGANQAIEDIKNNTQGIMDEALKDLDIQGFK